MKLIHCDCIEYMKTTDDRMDLTVTSPPYDNLRTYESSLKWDEKIWKQVIEGLWRVTKPGGVVVWIVGDATIKGSETGTSFKQALYFKEVGFNLHDTMIWEKTSFNHNPINKRYKQYFEYMFVLSKGKPKTYNEFKDVPCKKAGRIYKPSKRKADGSIRHFGEIKINDFQARSNIWKIFQAANPDHPAVFPEALANDHILSWSEEGDTVFDPFMGSGTTGEMALLNNRNFIGCEKVEKYFGISEERIKETQKEFKQKLLQERGSK